ncbi:hypothetical protein A3SI_20072 [Nitritalea halalkaliphila LW7]|uniref:Uncharacterized protein n=1 Tax=Nitritalea halalkaliphila LW7 TaxID=1189621 RepID=I5BR32_9BACT|nr:hypothetical protein [Nitritalea halalkaliphila]EIM72034.1 hypothetical protein A3SI_20072 [Nitritalea halalkaliphila LW7]
MPEKPTLIPAGNSELFYQEGQPSDCMPMSPEQIAKTVKALEEPRKVVAGIGLVAFLGWVVG